MTQERRAKEYLISLGKNPSEMVYGYWEGVRFCQARWRWYIGAR